jgi:tRNA (cytidine/uridine-2'-O-)-methyltransferase
LNAAEGVLPSETRPEDRGPRLALYQPDIPQNAGTMLRMAACFGVPVDIVEPAGFPVTDKHFRRAGMDYLDLCDITRHVSWSAFDATRRATGRRLVLLTTKGGVAHTDFAFSKRDTLMVGRESAGAPDDVHVAADARIVIPMRAELRSLNVAVAAAIVLAEALRQTGGFPKA